MSNLVQIFFDTAEKYPDHYAILYNNQRISYRDLASQAESTAAFLQRKGVVKGSRVLVFIPMSIKLYQTVLALFSLGAVVVFVDEWADRERLRKALEVVPVDVIIAPRKYLWLAYILNPFRKIASKISIPNRMSAELSEVVAVDDEDTALITFTTGSTGLPKAANRTHGFLKEQFRILDKEIGAGPEDSCLVTLPIVLLSILGTGATGIIANFNQKKPEELDAKQQRDLINQEGVTMLISSPYFVEKLAEVVNDTAQSSLRKVLTGGAPVFPDLAAKIIKAFPSAVCLVAYGSTEAEPISVVTMKDVELNDDGLLVGQVHEEIDLKIVRIIDGEIVMGSGGWSDWETAYGEIAVAGPHVLTNYYNSEEAFKLNKIVDGNRIWHRTGDSGRLVNGRLYLNGRCSQLIKSSDGYKSLFVMEYQLSQVKGVTIGTYIEDYIVLELEEGALESDVKAEVSALNLGEKEIRIISTIPRDPRHFSKIDYKALLAKF